MLYFEFKKVYKKKLFWIIILSSFLLSFITYIYSKFDSSPYISNESLSSGYYNYFDSLDLDSAENSHLSEKDKFEILRVKEKIRREFYKNRDINFEKIGDEKKALDFMKYYHNYILNLENLRTDYNIVLDSQTKSAWEWTLFEFDYMEKTNTPISQVSWASHSINPIRTLIFRSNLIFGIPNIIILIFLFSSIMSREKELESIIFLRTQPILKFKIILSKFLVVFLSSLIFLILTLVFLMAIFYFAGYNWHNGHLEIYRVFSKIKFSYITGGDLLLKIIFNYIFLLSFFSSIILFFSTLIKNSQKLMLILIFGSISFYIVSINFQVFKSPLNPFYLINIKDNLLGNIEYYVKNFESGWKYVNSNSTIYYFIFFIVSLVLIFISFKLQDTCHNNKYNINNIKKFTIIKFEIYKTIKNTSFLMSLMGLFSVFLILLFMLTISDKELDNIYKNGYLSYD